MSEPLIVQESEWEGRRLTASWLPASFVPPRELTTQAYGICFTENRQIVLVAGGDGRWNLPGGTIEPGETLEEALAREVWEEACARVVRAQYIGCQLVDDPAAPGGPTTYYQARFWARVEVYPFRPRFETVARKLIAPGEFLSTLFWGHVPIARMIFERGLAAENRCGSACI